MCRPLAANWNVESIQMCADIVFKSVQEYSARKACMKSWVMTRCFSPFFVLFEPLNEPMASTQDVYKSRVLNSIVVPVWAAYIPTHSNTFQCTLQTCSNLTGNTPPNLADAIKYALKTSHTNISQRLLNAGRLAQIRE